MTKFYKISNRQDSLENADKRKINIEEKKASSSAKTSGFWRNNNSVQNAIETKKEVKNEKVEPVITLPTISSPLSEKTPVNIKNTELKEKEVVVFDDVSSRWEIVKVYEL
jgi:hypothetical protein